MRTIATILWKSQVNKLFKHEKWEEGWETMLQPLSKNPCAYSEEKVHWKNECPNKKKKTLQIFHPEKWINVLGYYTLRPRNLGWHQSMGQWKWHFSWHRGNLFHSPKVPRSDDWPTCNLAGNRENRLLTLDQCSLTPLIVERKQKSVHFW